MEDEEVRLQRLAPCSSLVVDAIIRIGSAGVIWGICSGPYNARKQGLSGVAEAAFVAKSAGWTGIQCGLVAGIFTSTRCGLQKFREKDDAVNSLAAGAAVGAAIAAGTRSLHQGVGTAFVVSVFCAASEYFRTF